MSEKTCESCAMPMARDEDFPGGNHESRYCVHCGDAEGNLTATYESMLGWYTDDFVKSKGLDTETARAEARRFSPRFPPGRTATPECTVPSVGAALRYHAHPTDGCPRIGVVGEVSA